jgi:excisionase family DNA binding protein
MNNATALGVNRMETVKLFDDIELIKLVDISKKLGIHIVTLRRYIKSGKLKAQKLGNSYFVSKENFKEFINGGGTKR